MPKPTYNDCYLGLDPGETGGLAVLSEDGEPVFVKKMPETARDLFSMMLSITSCWSIKATVLERINPRPTRYFDKRSNVWVSTILRSTCIIYGDFLQLHMAAIAVGIEPFIVGPHEWQKFLGIPKREKKEPGQKFKARLKNHAVKLFPNQKITLATADSLLIAEYCRRFKWE